MRELIKLFAILVIIYCFIRLARSEDFDAGLGQYTEEYSYYFGGDFSSVCPVMARSAEDAANKVVSIEPSYNRMHGVIREHNATRH